MPTNAFIDETGKSYGCLLVLGPSPKIRGKCTWRVQCVDCGKGKLVFGSALRSGRVQSCMCHIGETRANSGARARAIRELKEAATEAKRCSRCKENLPAALFRQVRRGDSKFRNSWCVPCCNLASKAAKERSRRARGVKPYTPADPRKLDSYRDVYRKSHAERSYRVHVRRKYGVDYDALLNMQNGVCALCKKPDIRGKRLHVDHDHDTGKVRGLLCESCNVTLGFYEVRMRPFGKIDKYEDYLRSADGTPIPQIPHEKRVQKPRRIITFEGITKTLSEWARDLGIGPGGLSSRLETWPLEKALTTPAKITSAAAYRESRNAPTNI